MVNQEIAIVKKRFSVVSGLILIHLISMLDLAQLLRSLKR